MKKFKLMIVSSILLIISLSYVYSEEIVIGNDIPIVDNVTVTTTETERIIDKYADKVYNGISDVTAALKEPAAKVFGYVVKLNIAKGIALLLLLPLAIGCWIWFYISYSRISNKLKNIAEYTNKTWSDVDGGSMAVISLVVSLATSFGSIFSTYWGILYLIAPEWFAIKDIIELIN